MVCSVDAVGVDEVPERLVQSRGPHGADGVDFVQGVGAGVGEGVGGEGGGVGVRPQARRFVVDPGADRVVGGAGVGGFDADRCCHEVGPAFAHAAGFEDVETGRVCGTAGEPVGQAVGVLMDHDISFKRAVTHRGRVVPYVHCAYHKSVALSQL